MQPFVLVSDPSALRKEDVLMLEVDPTLADKNALFTWFAEHLKFPVYFGGNWDAFDEGLRDLSWVKQRRVVLFHRDLPLAGKRKDQKIYLDVLANAVRDWKSDPSHELVAAFVPSLEIKLHAVKRE